MTNRRVKKWKYTTHKINGRKRKVKIHRKLVKDGYLVRLVHKKRHHKRR